MKKRKVVTFVGSMTLAVIAIGQSVSQASHLPSLETKSEMFYALVAHPDDELAGWSMVERHSDDYTVFVTMTRGENTDSCMPAAEAEAEMKADEAAEDEEQKRNRFIQESTPILEGFGFGVERLGPFKYQGKDNPVGEPNKGERRPYGDPWVGQFSDACGDARIASWHWFLDEQHALDNAGTSMEIAEDPWLDDDFQETFCPPGWQGQGHGRPVEMQVPCADVWADQDGARVAFTYPNGDPNHDYSGGNEYPPPGFHAEDVVQAIGWLRANRASWGMPELPETGIVGAVHWNCGDAYDHPEHEQVLEALRFRDLGVGPQYGPKRCDDRFSEGAALVRAPLNPASSVLTNLIDAEENRLGPFLRNYGWVMPTYGFFMSNSDYWEVQEGS